MKLSWSLDAHLWLPLLLFFHWRIENWGSHSQSKINDQVTKVQLSPGPKSKILFPSQFHKTQFIFISMYKSFRCSSWIWIVFLFDCFYPCQKTLSSAASVLLLLLSYDLSGSEISWSHSVVNNWTNRFLLSGAKIVRILGLRILCECLQIIIVSANIQLAEVEFVWWRAAAGDSSRHPAGVQTLHPRQIHHRQPQWQVASIMSSIYWLLWMLIRHT